MKLKINKWIKLFLKLAITSFALWIILKKVDLSEIGQLIANSNFAYLFLAILFFVLSKIAGAVRLKYFFENINLYISHASNFRLYLIGMFHNLYLPGGVGGDGLKVYYLNRQYKSPVKTLIGAIFFDRLNGLIFLVLLALTLSLISNIKDIAPGYQWVLWILLFGIYPAYLLVMKKFFAKYHRHLIGTSITSLLSQVLQLVCTFFLLLSLHVQANFLEYQAIFLWASVLTIVPITFGGIGVREMIFIISHERLGLQQDLGVSFSLLFFVVTALVSISGAFLPVNNVRKEAESKAE